MAKPQEEFGLIEQLRQVIQSRVAGGASLNRLAKEWGVSTPQLSRFVRGIRTLTLPAADRICKALRLRLTDEPPTRKK